MGHSRNFKEPVAFPETYPGLFHGLVGRIVKLIEPCTEADPLAIYVQLLAGIGNILGNQVRLMVENKAVALNLFVVLVGDSARARKGTSLGQVMHILKQVEPEWTAKNVVNGLKTAEGLVHMVRDQENEAPGEEVDGDRMAEHGPDPSDKRRLLLLTEFGGPLRLMRSAASSLPDVLRQAHDGDTLDVPTKKKPERATNTHISLVGHITREELLHLMDPISLRNGLFNRIQWYAVRRSKILPFGGNPDPVTFEILASELKHVLGEAMTLGCMRLDIKAKRLFESVYEELQGEGDHAVELLASRGPGHVLRLSALLAAIDRSKVVHEQHIRSALTLWDYSRQSAEWAFTGAGDSFRDQVLAFVRSGGEHGRTATEIRDSLCHRNPAKGRKVHELLEHLRAKNLVARKQSATGGRPAERWVVVEPGKAA